MIFRNLRTGNLLTVEDEDVIDVMASSPNYEKVTEAVATPPPASPADKTMGNRGVSEGGEKATGTGEKKPGK